MEPKEPQIKDTRTSFPRDCDTCDNTGWVWKRVDVDAEKRVPCNDCHRGEQDPIDPNN